MSQSDKTQTAADFLQVHAASNSADALDSLARGEAVQPAAAQADTSSPLAVGAAPDSPTMTDPLGDAPVGDSQLAALSDAKAGAAAPRPVRRQLGRGWGKAIIPMLVLGALMFAIGGWALFLLLGTRHISATLRKEAIFMLCSFPVGAILMLGATVVWYEMRRQEQVAARKAARQMLQESGPIGNFDPPAELPPPT